MKTRVSLITPIVLFSLVAFYLTGFLHAQPSGTNKRIIGWVEYAIIIPQNLEIKAKMDTGARHSSLNAFNIAEFKHGGDEFVRFDLTNSKGRTETIEAKVIRMAKIKQHNSEPEHRPVIRIGICIGRVYREVEVNLENRRNFNYQLLIGRSFLKGEFAVDPSKTFTVKPDCR